MTEIWFDESKKKEKFNFGYKLSSTCNRSSLLECDISVRTGAFEKLFCVENSPKSEALPGRETLALTSDQTIVVHTRRGDFVLDKILYKRHCWGRSYSLLIGRVKFK